MNKVSEVVNKIEQLENQYKMLNDLAHKAKSENEISEYMCKTFGIYNEDIYEIASNIYERKVSLEKQLDKVEINID